MGHSSLTVDGYPINIFRLDPDLITTQRIAASLARMTRFAGHWNTPISVARHSLDVATRVKQLGGTDEEQLQALFHDAAEAYTCDMPGPWKHLLYIKHPDSGNVYSWNQLEDVLTLRIFDHLGIPWPSSPLVHKADVEAGQRDLIERTNEHSRITHDPDVVAELFRERARDLFARVQHEGS